MSGDVDDRPPADVVELPTSDGEVPAAPPATPVPSEDRADTSTPPADVTAPETQAGGGPHAGILDDGADRLPVEQLQDPDRLRSVIESVMLVADRPLAPARLAQILGGALEPGQIREVLEGWQEELDARDSGIRLLRVAGGYRLRTDSANASWIRALTRRRPVRLSRAALETLAIVAYRQPATRSDIDDVRGVDSSVVLRSLLEKDLLRIVGRKEEPGRPMVYGTTRRFLEVFGLGSLSDLPSLREFTQLSVGEQESLFGDHVLLEEEGESGTPEGVAEVEGEERGGDDAA